MRYDIFVSRNRLTLRHDYNKYAVSDDVAGTQTVCAPNGKFYTIVKHSRRGDQAYRYGVFASRNRITLNRDLAEYATNNHIVNTQTVGAPNGKFYTILRFVHDVRIPSEYGVFVNHNRIFLKRNFNNIASPKTFDYQTICQPNGKFYTILRNSEKAAEVPSEYDVFVSRNRIFLERDFNAYASGSNVVAARTICDRNGKFYTIVRTSKKANLPSSYSIFVSRNRITLWHDYNQYAIDGNVINTWTVTAPNGKFYTIVRHMR